MSNITIINATPHVVTVARSVFEGHSVYGFPPASLDARHHRQLGDLAYFIEPSGLRLAADPVTDGPDLGCSVRYEASDTAQAEMDRLKLVFSEHQGTRHLVIASEISCRAMAAHVVDETMATSIELMWPVLATGSLMLPMNERWADRLATAAT